MKTAEKYLKGIKVYDRELDELLSIHGNFISDLMEQYANAKSKALLEEAAEKARLKMLEDQKPTPYEMEDFILSLIHKEETK